MGALVPGLQWLAPIGAVLSGGSTINSLGGFSTGGPFGGGGGINGGPWDEQISIASGKGIPQWAVWNFGSITGVSIASPQPAFVDIAGILSLGSWTPLSSPRRAASRLVPGGRVAGACMEPALNVAFRITTPFGQIDGTHAAPHGGRDYANWWRGSNLPSVYAAEAGTVRTTPTQRSGGFGNLVTVLSPDLGLSTLYGHLSSFDPMLRNGDRVVAGQRLGTVGTTGFSNGNHLHFEQRASGRPTNPCTF